MALSATKRGMWGMCDHCTERGIMDDEVYEIFKRGTELLASGNPAQAAVLFERAAMFEPGKGSIWEALGRAHFAMRRHEEAADSFARAIEVDPSNDYAHYALAVSLECLGILDEARGHIKLALAMAPENPDYELAWARIRMRDAKK